MFMTTNRPIDIDDHPVVRKRYLVATPTIDLVTQRIVKQIRQRNPGAILYGYRHTKQFCEKNEVKV